MSDDRTEATTAAAVHGSAEIGAVGALAEAVAAPMMAVLLAEIEVLGALIPGQHPAQADATDTPAAPAGEADPFDNMPV